MASKMVEVVATFHMISNAHTNILFIIKVKILVLIKWLCRYPPSPRPQIMVIKVT